MNKEKAIVLTNGILDTNYAKTGHGLIRGTERFDILAVIDYKFAGQDAGEVLDGIKRNIPIFASIADFLATNAKPVYCIVGVASAGGYLPTDFRQEIANAIQRGISVICGLHAFLSEDLEFSTLAKKHQVEIIDIRKPRPRTELKFWSGAIYEVKTPKIAVLGMDCAIGKRTTCRFLAEMCRKNGVKAEMIYTGQTGWLQGSKHGFIFDSTVNDFISGEIERVIVECAQESNPDIILIEGQSALRNPTGPAGSEFLLSGNVKGVILQHAPGRACFDGTEAFDNRLPSLESEIQLIALYGATILGITLNEEHQSEAEISAYQTKMEKQLNIPVVRPLKEGVNRLFPNILDFIRETMP